MPLLSLPAECQPGFFGPGCRQACTCPPGVACNRVSGECGKQCPTGYRGEDCSQGEWPQCPGRVQTIWPCRAPGTRSARAGYQVSPKAWLWQHLDLRVPTLVMQWRLSHRSACPYSPKLAGTRVCVCTCVCTLCVCVRACARRPGRVGTAPGSSPHFLAHSLHPSPDRLGAPCAGSRRGLLPGGSEQAGQRQLPPGEVSREAWAG